MGRKKGSVNKAKKPLHSIEVAVHGTETEKTKDAMPCPDKPLETDFKESCISFDCDCWIYHETDSPRMLKSGNAMPKGWTSEKNLGWHINDYGNWTRSQK